MRKQITILVFFYLVCGFGQSADLNLVDSLYATGSYTKAINAYAGLGTSSAGLQIARASGLLETTKRHYCNTKLQ